MTGRQLIVGAGALGALLAAQWTLAGVPAVLVARGAQLDAIVRDGVRVRRPQGDDTVRVEVVAGIADAAPRPGDTVVLAVKAQDVESALAAIAWEPLAGGGVVADLPVLTLQNGLATEDAALRRFARVIGASVGIAASHLEPGVVVSPSWPTVGVARVGGYPASDPLGDDAAALALQRAGFAVSVVDDIAAAKRRKLLANLRNVVEVFAGDDDEIEAVTEALRAEAGEVFARLGLPVAEWTDDVPRLSLEPVPGHAENRLSTWQSLARGTSLEGDYLSGEIVALARRAGVAAPLNADMQRAIGVLGARRAAPGITPLPASLRRATASAARSS